LYQILRSRSAVTLERYKRLAPVTSIHPHLTKKTTYKERKDVGNGSDNNTPILRYEVEQRRKNKPRNTTQHRLRKPSSPSCKHKLKRTRVDSTLPSIRVQNMSDKMWLSTMYSTKT